MPSQQNPIPQSLFAPLQAAGYDQQILAGMPYANGVIAVVSGDVQNDGNIITQEIQTALTNVGWTMDDLGRFITSLDENLKVVAGSMPGFPPADLANFETMYFTFLLEYLKVFGVTNKYYPPEYIVQLAKQRIPQEFFGQLINMQVINKNRYALSIKSPMGITTQICPWIFVYNDGGKTRLFHSKDEMDNYNAKYGKNIGAFIKKAFSKENFHITGIVGISAIGIAIAIGIFLKKRKEKKNEEEQSIINEIESSSVEDGD